MSTQKKRKCISTQWYLHKYSWSHLICCTKCKKNWSANCIVLHVPTQWSGKIDNGACHYIYSIWTPQKIHNEWRVELEKYKYYALIFIFIKHLFKCNGKKMIYYYQLLTWNNFELFSALFKYSVLYGSSKCVCVSVCTPYIMIILW